MPKAIYKIHRATPQDLNTIIQLIDEASKWLRLKDTDQWARPWPDAESRRQRILDGMRNGITWIVRDGDDTVATISMTSVGNPLLWSPEERREPAVYLHRLVVSRKYAGQGVGAALLEWAAQQGRIRYGAEIVRIDVWQDNLALHSYYRRLGFKSPSGTDETEVRVRDKNFWPSGAVFQRDISNTTAHHISQRIIFIPEPQNSSPFEISRHRYDTPFSAFALRTATASPW